MGRATLAAVLVIILAGCGKDKVTEPPPLPFVPSPADPLLSLEVAWEQRDSVRMRSILSDDYIGMSTDQTDPGSGTLTFTKNDEVSIVRAMKEDTTILSVSVDFGPASSWTRTSDPSDPQEWATIQIPIARIQVDNGVDLHTADGPGLMEFKVKPATVSGTDTTWSIVRWTEIRSP